MPQIKSTISRGEVLGPLAHSRPPRIPASILHICMYVCA